MTQWQLNHPLCLPLNCEKLNACAEDKEEKKSFKINE